MSRAADPYDHAFAESCLSCFKAEVLQGGAFLDVAYACSQIFDYIDIY